MRVLFLTLLVSLLLPAVIQAQRLSPLFNVIGANSSIDDDPAFRKMHDAISDALKNQPSGLRIGAVYDKFKEFRTAVIGRIRAIRLMVDDTPGTEAISIVLPKLTNLSGPIETEPAVTFKLATPGTTTTWGTLKNTIRAEIKARIKDLLEKALASKSFSDVVKSDVQQWFFASLRATLKSSGLAPDRDPDGTTEAGKFADMFATIVVERSSNRLQEALSDHASITLTDETTISSALISIKNRFKQLCEEQFAGGVEAIAQAVIDQFDKLESTIARASEKVDNFLVAAHAGLAVSDSGGDTQAGITLTWRPSDFLQAGVFTNLQLDAPTKKQTGPLMLGFGLRGTLEQVQLDLIGGWTFRDSVNAGVSNSFDGGIGVSVNAGTMVIGIMGTYLKRNILATDSTAATVEETISAGLQLRLLGAGLPTFTFVWNFPGMALERNGMPIVQVSFPIQSNP